MFNDAPFEVSAADRGVAAFKGLELVDLMGATESVGGVICPVLTGTEAFVSLEASAVATGVARAPPERQFEANVAWHGMRRAATARIIRMTPVCA